MPADLGAPALFLVHFAAGWTAPSAWCPCPQLLLNVRNSCGRSRSTADVGDEAGLPQADQARVGGYWMDRLVSNRRSCRRARGSLLTRPPAHPLWERSQYRQPTRHRDGGPVTWARAVGGAHWSVALRDGLLLGEPRGFNGSGRDDSLPSGAQLIRHGVHASMGSGRGDRNQPGT